MATWTLPTAKLALLTAALMAPVAHASAPGVVVPNADLATFCLCHWSDAGFYPDADKMIYVNDYRQGVAIGQAGDDQIDYYGVEWYALPDVDAVGCLVDGIEQAVLAGEVPDFGQLTEECSASA